MKRRLFVSGIAAALAAPTPVEAAADLSDFTHGSFSGADGKERTYYRSGTGPPVMVLHEIYGLSAADIAFCRRLRAYGFTIYAPILVGTAGHAETIGYKAQCTTKVCVSREFAAFELNKSSPVCDSLRILGRSIYSEHGAPGFGVIGLCLTGNFALAMMADETLVAPVVAEPSLPFDWTPSGRRSLHLSDDEITCIKRRVRSGTKILGYRFAADGVSPPERFARMREEFGEGFEGHEILSTSKGHHSVFTEHYDDSAPSTRGALDRLVSFLRERLSTDG